MPAGFPAEGAKIVLLDDELGDVGFDAVGEIVVKSKNLALGYWQQSELTRAKFRADPDGGDMRWYFTGDLGRMTPDGCLYILGRKDFTAKVRGRSVILSEIETALLEHPAVKEVAVISVADSDGDQRLVAYVVSSQTPAPSLMEMRDLLMQRFPDYAVPSAFVILDAMPLTPSGKIDRNALPAPDQQRLGPVRDYIAPRTPTEAKLVMIWAEVLKVESPDIYDNFFDLGGHSLAAARVITRVVQTFQLDLPVKALFEAPTIAQMAEVIMANTVNRAGDAELAQMLREIEAMTEEEAQRGMDKMNLKIADE